MPLALGGEAQARPLVRRDQFGDALPEGALARMGTIRLRHGDEIIALTFSSDGKLLASGGGCDIHLWDPDTGKLVRLLKHESTVNDLAFSPDGRLLVSVSNNNSLLVWEVSTGRLLYRVRGGVWSIAFTPDGKSLTLGCNEGVIRMLDARTGKETSRLCGCKYMIGAIAFSPDGKTLASMGYDVIRIWDTVSGKVLRQWTAKNADCKLAISPDGKILATWWSGFGIVHLYSVSSAKRISRVDVDVGGGQIRVVAFTSDGRSLVTVDDMKACLWDVATCKERRSARKEGFEDLRCLALTPDGKRLALAGGDHCIRFWETATARECTPSSSGHLRPNSALAVSLEASWVASADDGDDGAIRIWDLNSGKQLRLFQAGSRVGALALSPRGDTLVSASYYALRCWDPATGKQQRQLVSHTGPIAGPSPPHYLSFSADGKQLLVHGYNGGLCYLDARKDKPTRELRKDFMYVALSPDSKTVVGVVLDTVQFWDLATGKMRKKRSVQGGKPLCAAFSPDGRLVVTGELLWDVEEGKVLRRFLGPENSDFSIYSAAFSPDGKMLVTGTTCGVVQLWEVETGKERRRFVGHRGIVHAVAFCRSGQAVVSGSEDTSLLVWDVTGHLLFDAKHRTTLTAEQLKDLWTNLGGADARKAYEAMCSLAASPSGVPAFVLRRIRSSFQYDRAKVEKWVAQLDDEQFAVREGASRKLEELGDRAEPALQGTLTRTSSLEQRRRVRGLLRHLHSSTHPPERILALRTVELLERIGTTEAREGLRTIAKESPGTLIRRNAEAALLRLSRKPPANP